MYVSHVLRKQARIGVMSLLCLLFVYASVILRFVVLVGIIMTKRKKDRELERQKRVLNLMQEICTLSQDPGSSKDVKGKYNDGAANKLWDLYQKIDGYHKSKVNSSTNINE